MAAPENKTIHSLDGKWVMKNKLSDSFDPALAVQGVGWVTRKALSVATVTQQTKQYTDENGAIHIDIIQTATGGIKGNTEKRTLTWTPSTHADWLFGEVVSRSRMTTFADIKANNSSEEVTKLHAKDLEFLTTGWLPESMEGDVVQSLAVNEKGKWSGMQIWGFSEVDNGGKKERWLTRKSAIRRTDKDQVAYVRLVYEWLGEE